MRGNVEFWDEFWDKDWIAGWCLGGTVRARRWALGSVAGAGALWFLTQLLVFLGLLMLGLLMLMGGAMMLLARWTYFFSVTAKPHFNRYRLLQASRLRGPSH